MKGSHSVSVFLAIPRAYSNTNTGNLVSDCLFKMIIHTMPRPP